MKQRYILFRRAGMFDCEGTVTRKQLSLKTRDEAESRTLLNAKNESMRQPVLNLQIARAYLTAGDPAIGRQPQPGSHSGPTSHHRPAFPADLRNRRE